MKRLSRQLLEATRQRLQLVEAFGKLEGTKTAENLQEAFTDEALDHTKYLWAAKMASAEGYPEIAAAFEEAAAEELVHAHTNLNYLMGMLVGFTEKNIQSAIEGETKANKTDYPEMAAVAKDEGFEEISEWFSALARTEGEHARWFKEAQSLLRKG